MLNGSLFFNAIVHSQVVRNMRTAEKCGIKLYYIKINYQSTRF